MSQLKLVYSNTSRKTPPLPTKSKMLRATLPRWPSGFAAKVTALQRRNPAALAVVERLVDRLLRDAEQDDAPHRAIGE